MQLNILPPIPAGGCIQIHETPDFFFLLRDRMFQFRNAPFLVVENTLERLQSCDLIRQTLERRLLDQGTPSRREVFRFLFRFRLLYNR